MRKLLLSLAVMAIIASNACKQEQINPEPALTNQKTEVNQQNTSAALVTNPTVTIGGNKFYVEGKEIFFNGINTAWQKQADYTLDFLGRNFDRNWWINEFQRYKDNRINLARVWIHGAGEYSPSLIWQFTINFYNSDDYL